MPRTIDATLEAALATGKYQPYIVAFLGGLVGGIFTPEVTLATIIDYELSRNKLNLKAVSAEGTSDYFHIVLRRGITTPGSNYYVDTSAFAVTRYKHDGIYFSVEADLIPKTYVSTAGDVTYTTILNAFATAIERTAIRKNSSHALWNNKFFPAGKLLILNKATQLAQILKQKFCMTYSDYGNNQIYFYCAKFAASQLPTPTGDLEYTITVEQPLEVNNPGTDYLFFSILWRDEAATIHKETTGPYYNIGYLETTAVKPNHRSDNLFQYPQTIKPIKEKMNLTYLSGDTVKITSSYNNTSVFGILDLVEYLHLDQTPPWGLKVSILDYVSNTEGGALPSTIEAAAPYTPLATGNFDSVLSANDNNIQAAMETINDHHSGIAPAINTPTATNNFLVGEQVATVWTWVRKTLAQTVTILRT